MLLDEAFWAAPLPGTIEAYPDGIERITVVQEHEDCLSERRYTLRKEEPETALVTFMLGTLDRETLGVTLEAMGYPEEYEGWQVFGDTSMLERKGA